LPLLGSFVWLSAKPFCIKRKLHHLRSINMWIGNGRLSKYFCTAIFAWMWQLQHCYKLEKFCKSSTYTCKWGLAHPMLLFDWSVRAGSNSGLESHLNNNRKVRKQALELSYCIDAKSFYCFSDLHLQYLWNWLLLTILSAIKWHTKNKLPHVHVAGTRECIAHASWNC